MSEISWERISGSLAEKISPEEFATWLSPLQVSCQITGDDENKGGKDTSVFFNVSIKAENKYKMDFVKNHYGDDIRDTIAALCNTKQLQPKIKYSYGRKQRQAPRRKTDDAALLQRARGNGTTTIETSIGYKSKISPRMQFSNFMAGSVNRVAKEAAESLADDNKRPGNFFLFYGDSGLGKTHLLQAAAKEFEKNKRSVIYVRGETFVRSMYHHLTEKKMERFKDIYRNVNILIVDDIQVLKNKPKAQEEFFHTLDARLSEEDIVLLSANVSSPEMDYFGEALRSRLTSALALRLDKPNKDTWRKIICQKCSEGGMRLDPKCTNHIAEKMTGSVREMEGVLKLVRFYIGVYKKPANLSMLRKVFQNMSETLTREPSPDEIRLATERHYQLPVNALKNSGRAQTFVAARRMAMFLCRELTSRSTTEIAAAFNRKHSAVVQAVGFLNNDMQKDSIKCAYEAIKKEIVSLMKR